MRCQIVEPRNKKEANKYDSISIATCYTWAKEKDQGEYIPANLSLYKTVLSVAIYGSTVEQLFTPKKSTATYKAPNTLNKSCWLFLQKIRPKKEEAKTIISKENKKLIDLFTSVAYISCPCFQKSAPIIKDESTKYDRRTKLYAGLLQYERCCFHKQALNWPQPFCG